MSVIYQQGRGRDLSNSCQPRLTLVQFVIYMKSRTSLGMAQFNNNRKKASEMGRKCDNLYSKEDEL